MMPNHEQQIAENEAQLKKEGIQALSIGALAPPLTGATDAAGAPVVLADLLAQHKTGVVLFFFPALDTPNSNGNLADLDRRRSALEAQGLGVYAVCPAAPAAATAYFQQLGISLPLLADPSGTLAQAYGCLASGGQFPQRTVAVVGDKAGIVYFHRGPLDQPAQAAMEKALGLTTAPSK